MLKAIFAKDVREGDEILISGGKRVSVAWVYQRGPVIRIGTGEEHLGLGEYDVVGLGHRPWPEGKTNSDMLQAIAVAAHEVHALRGYTIGLTAQQRTPPEFEQAVIKLHEAIEAYELGKPSEPKRVERNESLVDRHMIP